MLDDFGIHLQQQNGENNYFNKINKTKKIRRRLNFFVEVSKCEKLNVYFFIFRKMPCTQLPEYPSLEEVSEEELRKIEDECRKKGHLGKDESLLARIAEDAKTLAQYRVSKSDIFHTHVNMYLLFHHRNEFGKFTLKPENFGKTYKEMISNAPSGWGSGAWSCSRPKKMNVISLNGQRLQVLCLIWQGAEECPIEKSFVKNKYFGYRRGDRDYYVKNLDRNIDMFVPDLLPHQVGMFGFFQGLESSYRMDPETYIKVFGLDVCPKPVEIIKTRQVPVWFFSSSTPAGGVHPPGGTANGGGPDTSGTQRSAVHPPGGTMTLDFVKSKCQFVESQSNDVYDAHLVIFPESYEHKLVIHFHDPTFPKKNPREKIEIFKRTLHVRDMFNTSDYTEFGESYLTVLVEQDDSEDMAQICTRESPGACAVM
jgi:hypothetical protein